jgi:hypothetical protein
MTKQLVVKEKNTYTINICYIYLLHVFLYIDTTHKNTLKLKEKKLTDQHCTFKSWLLMKS